MAEITYEDKREAILQRLLAVAKAVDETFEARRNETRLSDKQKYVVLLDGEETAMASDPVTGRAASAPRRVQMVPEIQFRVGAEAEDVGTILNRLRIRLIASVLTDATLLGLTVNNHSIRYEGSNMVAERGRSMEGGIGIAFTFTYALYPGRTAV